MPKLQYALDWAARGFKVFPLVAGSKKPAIKGWPEAATNDELQIRSWWSDGAAYNIGVLTDDLIVVDVDDKKGKHGSQSLVELDLPLEALETLTVTTPSGGRHVYFQGPSRSLSVGALGGGLDIRSFHGYVLAPGSTIDETVDPSSGCSGTYRLDLDCDLQPVPVELLARLDEPLERSALAPAVLLDQPAAVDRAARFLEQEAPAAVEFHGGNQTTFRVAATLKDYGVSEAMAADLMADWNDRCSPPWALDELQTIIANAYSYGSRVPGSLSPEVDFADVKVPLPARPGRQWLYHADPIDLNAAWLFHELLPATGVALLIGPSQSGKTFVLAELARTLATGRPFFNIEPEALGGTLFLFAGTEGSGFAQRMAALEEPEPLPIAATHVSALREQGALGDLLADLKTEAARMLAEYKVPLRMVVLETLSASGLLEDEDSNAQAAQAIENLATISRELGVLFVTSHHPPKGGVGSRGASAIPNNADYVVEITRVGTEAVRSIALTKARNASQRKLGSFTLAPVVIGADAKGRDVTSMVLSTGGVRSGTAKATANTEKLMECIEHAFVDHAEVVKGLDVVSEDYVRDNWKARGGYAHASSLANAFTKAMAAAEDAGVIECIAYAGDKYVQRKEIL